MSVSPRELPSAQDRHGARQAQDALIGREAELDALRVFVDQVVTDGAVLLISGDAGVGKTVLLDAAADLASAAGARVVRSAGVQSRSTSVTQDSISYCCRFCPAFKTSMKTTGTR